jgi:predicted nuclease of restriction endonuclease-like (RecB) superfamily
MLMEFADFVKEIKGLIRSARKNVISNINFEMLNAYYQIGRRIVEEEQAGRTRAEYGKALLKKLSGELTTEFGRGFSSTALKNMRKFYSIYKDKIGQSVTDQFYKLSWTHYCELIKINQSNKRLYFEKYAAEENLSVRELKRQIHCLHYERLLVSQDKKALLKHDMKNAQISRPEHVIKDPYVLEFLGIKESHIYDEKELEKRLLDELQAFLLELGQGFSFIARQKRFTVDNEHFYIDLLFYNIYLRCYVVIELKIGKFNHKDVGQLNFYLNYVREEINKKEDSEPIGIILCTEKDRIHVEYATSGISNKLFVSKYQLYLPKAEELEKELGRML